MGKFSVPIELLQQTCKLSAILVFRRIAIILSADLFLSYASKFQLYYLHQVLCINLNRLETQNRRCIAVDTFLAVRYYYTDNNILYMMVII